MADFFRCNDVGPNDTGLVIVGEIGWEGGIRKKNAEIGKWQNVKLRW